jgi:hypothetical protein
MLIVRVRSVKTGKVDAKYFKSYATNLELPKDMVNATRNFSNLMEMPTLFYVLSLFILVTKTLDLTLLILAWSYVVLRVFHSVIHITKNKIYPRMISYSLSWLVLVFMWILLISKIM